MRTIPTLIISSLITLIAVINTINSYDIDHCVNYCYSMKACPMKNVLMNIYDVKCIEECFDKCSVKVGVSSANNVKVRWQRL